MTLFGRDLFVELLARQKDAEKGDLPRVKISTNKGDIVVELFEDIAAVGQAIVALGFFEIDLEVSRVGVDHDAVDRVDAVVDDDRKRRARRRGAAPHTARALSSPGSFRRLRRYPIPPGYRHPAA